MKQKATFGGGCFWCTEAIFQRVKSVTVIPGYAGSANYVPTYETLHNLGGYVESIQIEFDPNVVSYEQLLDIFFHTHDPTTVNKQGNDVGEQYRSVIFYHNDEQRSQAFDLIKMLEPEFESKIVTSVEPLDKFYSAEEYHQNYFDRNRDQPYCKLIINPKVKKFLASEKYKNLLNV